MHRRSFDNDDEWDDVESSWTDSDGEDDFGDEDYGDDSDDTIPCPQCRRQIHEESQRCPHCAHYLTEEEPDLTSKRWWIILGAFLCLYAMYRSIVGG